MGFKSLTYVVDEPDAFNLNRIKAKQSKSNEAGNGLGLSFELISAKEFFICVRKIKIV